MTAQPILSPGSPTADESIEIGPFLVSIPAKGIPEPKPSNEISVYFESKSSGDEVDTTDDSDKFPVRFPGVVKATTIHFKKTGVFSINKSVPHTGLGGSS